MKQKIQLKMNVPDRGYSLKIDHVYRHKNQLVAVAMMRYQRDKADFGLTTISDEVAVELEDVNAVLSVRYQVVMFHPHQVTWREWQPENFRHQLECVASFNHHDLFVEEGTLLYTSRLKSPWELRERDLMPKIKGLFFREEFKLICDRPQLSSTLPCQ